MDGPKGRSQKGEGFVKCEHGRGKDCADVRKLGLLFVLFQYVLQILSMGDAQVLKYCYLTRMICATEYNMGWQYKANIGLAPSVRLFT